MLEVRHLRKEYKTKNGVVTKALDDVSLTFPETGMIFILGKSGSGKSTLLNVCGGLDKADSGEIIIKGKSSKDFSGQDFDSYRNTYVGFVFQEYNVLDEFTVEDNIALALELQNKKHDKAVIQKILEDVDMTTFASRKPNTLSGGQKQRVAIARALVKEPQIIMADEPTGALDSKTGQQVFDTLKKLSKEKLVIVISHDRDFAEQYGDRIIELKDGKILSDQTRAPLDENHKNVRFYGTDVVCVANGAELSDDDLQNIKKFLKNSGGSAVISTSREQITKMQQDRPEIDVGAFENLKEQPKSKEYPPQKLIRSHLPMRHAVRMGGSSLKTKPVRLMFTIILSIVAFVLFGLASTLMLFDGHEVTVQTFMDSGIDNIVLAKYYTTTETYSYGDESYSYEGHESTEFTDDEYNQFAQKYNGALRSVDGYYSISNITMSSYTSNFYGTTVYGFVAADKSLNLLAGVLPVEEDEIAITDFMFDGFKSSGTKLKMSDGENESYITVSNYNSVLYDEDSNKFTLNLNNKKYKIVGIYKGMTVPVDYQSMKEAADKNESSNSGMSSWTWNEELRNGIYARVAVSEETFKNLAVTSGGSNINVYMYFKRTGDEVTLKSKVSEESEYNSSQYRLLYLSDYSSNAKLKIYGFDGESKSSVGNGEIYLSYSRLGNMLYNAYYEFVNSFERDSEYRMMLQQVYNAACEKYEEEHPQPEQYDPAYFDQAAYDKDVEVWDSHYRQYLQAYPGTTKEQFIYETNEQYPDSTEYKYYETKYNAAWYKYVEARDEYAENARMKASKNSAYLVLRKQLYDDIVEEYSKKYPMPDRNKYWDEYQQWLNEVEIQVDAADPLKQVGNFNRYENNYSTSQISEIFKSVKQLFEEMNVPFDFEFGNELNGYSAVTVSGFFIADYCEEACYIGSNLYNHYYTEDNNYNYDNNITTKYEKPDGAYIDRIYIPYNGDRDTIETLLQAVEVKAADDSYISVENSVMSSLDMIIDIANTLEKAFIIVGLVLALFAFLLMFNFISASITAKKKEIGILRAIGARITDVFKIFLSEAFIIALICFVISTAGSFGVCILLNSIILEDAGISASLFVFGPLSVLFILGIALLTAFISTLLPVALYSRKPPVDSIRAL